MPLGLLIPLFSPVVTEVVKWLFGKIIVEVPAPVVPIVSAAVGAAATVLGPYAGVDFGVSPAEGAALGLGGTGVHQVQKLTRGK